MSALSLYSQIWLTLPVPKERYTDQTVIVTGSNGGMGLEAARYFARLDAAQVILAVRSLEKGGVAKEDIEASTGKQGVVEVWELDLASYASVLDFSVRVDKLERLDVLISNAGVFLWGFGRAEQKDGGEGQGDEMTIAVNVVGTMLLAILVLPKIRETSQRTGKEGVLSFTRSFTHVDTLFSERKAGSIFEELSVEGRARMGDRYRVSKLIQLLCTRAFASAISQSDRQQIIVSTVNPGFVKTDIMRHTSWVWMVSIRLMQRVMARTPEEGARTLVCAAEMGVESHGAYLDDCKLGRVSTFVGSEEGKETQGRLWKELGVKLEGIKPGIMGNI